MINRSGSGMLYKEARAKTKEDFSLWTPTFYFAA